MRRWQVVNTSTKKLVGSFVSEDSARAKARENSDYRVFHQLDSDNPLRAEFYRKEQTRKRDPMKHGSNNERARLIRAIYKKTPRDYRTRTGGTHNIMQGERSGGGLVALEKLSTERLRELVSSRDPRRRRKSSRDCVGVHTHENLGKAYKASRDPQRVSVTKRKWISNKIRLLREEGHPRSTAVAIAYRMAGVKRPKSMRTRHLTTTERRQELKARRASAKRKAKRR